MDIGGDIVTVQSSTIRINLQEDFIEQEIGNVSRKGKWKLYFEGKTYFILKMKLEGQVVEERVILYKKSSKITREGLFPQPSAELNKIL